MATEDCEIGEFRVFDVKEFFLRLPAFFFGGEALYWSGRDDCLGHRPRIVDDRAGCADRLRLVEAQTTYRLAVGRGPRRPSAAARAALSKSLLDRAAPLVLVGPSVGWGESETPVEARACLVCARRQDARLGQ